jgi:heat shock protein HslJ
MIDLRIAAAMLVAGSLTACSSHPTAAQSTGRSPAAAAGFVTGNGWSSSQHRYRCGDGSEIQVAYLNLQAGESFASLYYDGKLSMLQLRPAASGALYIAIDEQNSLRWRTKGDSGFLTFLAADHTAKEEALLSDCNDIEKASPPTAAFLQGSEWVLERIGETPVIEGAKPTLAFYEPGRIAGNASCNRYTGSAEITPDGTLKVGLPAALATTRMMCGPEAMAQEQRFLTALGLGGAMSLAGNRLTIQAATPGESLVFVRSK